MASLTMSTALPSTRRRFWFDPRFAIGLGLVAVSVIGVGVIVARAEQSVTVYTARHTLAVGDGIDVADLVPMNARFTNAESLYLTPERLPADGALVTRTVAAGELVPVTAVGGAAGATVTNIVVDLRGRLAESIVAGTVVDVWAAPQTEPARFGPPAVLVAAAGVVRVLEDTGLIATEGAQSVEILVPKTAVAAVLESLANGDALAVVPVNSALEP
ncbi:MAG: hypothetical protein R6W83_10840 [Cryobacterium sp.]